VKFFEIICKFLVEVFRLVQIFFPLFDKEIASFYWNY